jgi:hypothetical protein
MNPDPYPKVNYEPSMQSVLALKTTTDPLQDSRRRRGAATGCTVQTVERPLRRTAPTGGFRQKEPDKNHRTRYAPDKPNKKEAAGTLLDNALTRALESPASAETIHLSTSRLCLRPQDRCCTSTSADRIPRIGYRRSDTANRILHMWKNGSPPSHRRVRPGRCRRGEAARPEAACRERTQLAQKPPSITSSVPVTNLASGEARYTTP